MKSSPTYRLGTSAIRDHLLGENGKPVCRSSAYIVGCVALTPDNRDGVTCIKCQQAMVRLGIHPQQDAPSLEWTVDGRTLRFNGVAIGAALNEEHALNIAHVHNTALRTPTP